MYTLIPGPILHKKMCAEIESHDALKYPANNGEIRYE